MITLKEFLEVVDYRITEGSDFGWQCFGPKVHTLSAWNGGHDGWSFNVTFSTEDQTVFVAESCDYKNGRAYRLLNPDHKDAYLAEAEEHKPYGNQAWDGVDYIDLEVDDDWIQKALDIKLGVTYDTRVQVPLILPDDEVFELMKIAHQRDITLNRLVEEMLEQYIAQHTSKLD